MTNSQVTLLALTQLGIPNDSLLCVCVLQVDTLLMKHFLSAFSDADSVTIIKHCKQTLAPSGAILLLQTLVPEPGDREHNTTEDGVAPGVCVLEGCGPPGGGGRVPMCGVPFDGPAADSALGVQHWFGTVEPGRGAVRLSKLTKWHALL
jgi:hypothetical protein